MGRAGNAAYSSLRALDSIAFAGILPRSDNGVFPGVNVIWTHIRGTANAERFMKRQYQPSKMRRKRQHGFLNRNSSKSGKAILRNRRRNGRKRLTPV
jgi:large subunit ribosomal protein L34